MSSYKLLYNLEQRKLDTSKTSAKYPERVPIILENCTNSGLPPIDKVKYLVPQDLSVTQFIYVIRKRLKLDKKQDIYLYIGNHVPNYHETFSDIYNCYKDDDGFLYINYSNINIVPTSPNPMELLVKLALLNFSKSGSKLTFYNGKLYIDKPDLYQGVNRWYYGSSRNDIVKFDVSLIQCLNIYYNSSTKQLFNYAYEGLGKLRHTYSDDKNLQNVLQNDQQIMKNYMDKCGVQDEKDAQSNIITQINSLFEKLNNQSDKEKRKEIINEINNTLLP